MAKINENERAAKALAETGQVQARSAFPGHHQPSIDGGGDSENAEMVAPVKADA
jgi:hypothetical protein